MNGIADSVASPAAQLTGIVACCTVAYYWNSPAARNAVMSVSIEAIRFFSRLQLLSNHMLRGCRDLASGILCCLDTGAECPDVYLVRDGERVCDLLPGAIPDCSYDMIMCEAEAGKYFVRFDAPPATIEFSPVGDVLVVADIHYAGHTYMIDNLPAHCIADSILFDRPHVQWLMKRFHETSIFDEDYSVDVMTGGLKQIRLSSHLYIEMGTDGFKVRCNGNLKIDVGEHHDDPVWRNLTEADIADTSGQHTHNSQSSDSSYDLVEEITVES
jgi:hypothetical protein